MKFSWLATALILLTAVSACDDPTNVGLDLAGGQTGEPFVRAIAPSTFETADVRDITGDAATMLAGGVSNTLLGEFAAQSNIDMVSPTLSTAFRTGPVTEAWIELAPTTTFGDTVAEFDWIVSDITSPWTAFGATSDTLLAVGAEIIRSPANATQSSFRIDLGSAWIATNDTLVRGTAFNVLHDGFNISTNSNQVAFGLSEANSRMRIISGGDTANFLVAQNLTTTQRITPPALPTDRVLLQDGLGEGVKVGIDVSDPQIEGSLISKGVLRIPADTTALQTFPSNVSVPGLQEVELLVVTAEDNRVPLQVGSINNGVVEFAGSTLQIVLQSMFDGEDTYSHFELSGPTAASSLSSLILYDTGAGTSAPALVITASSIDE